MKHISLFLLMIFPIMIFPYTWTSFGPQYIDTYDFYVNETGTFCEMICAEDGLYLYENDGWYNYSNGNLPVLSAEDLSGDEVLVIMAGGSWSDGIYKFNLITHVFEVLNWCYYPSFITYCSSNGKYYAGYYYGLLESSDGIYWQGVEYFNGKYCTTFAYLNEHLVVGNTGNIYGVHYSDDYGATWYESETSPHVSDMIFFTGETLYGIFPGDLDTSGIWMSQDYGASWYQLYYSYEMRCISTNFDGNLFVGWGPETFNRQTGVGIWDPVTNTIEEMNEGLPYLDIYKLTYHPLIDCVNIIACTNGGAYMLNNYQVSTNDENLVDNSIELNCFPNPFVFAGISTHVTFTYNSDRENPADHVVIYNIKGQLVKKISKENINGNYFTWAGTDSSNNLVDTGVYLYRLSIDKRNSQLKKILFMR